MDPLELHDRIARLERTPGGESRVLRLGDLTFGLDGLDADLAAELDRRWGGFLTCANGAGADYRVHVLDAGRESWLELPRGIEPYRLEALNDSERRVVASYHFAVAAGIGPGNWRVGLTDQDREPRQRCMDNALRFVVAHAAATRGGFALHAAGVVREGRAFLFAGPSRAGKTTAVALAAPAASLGDDFGVVLPGEEGWHAPALPFDNSERVSDRPCGGRFPVAGVWRLFRAAATRVETPARRESVASLLGCAAFPWTMPELAPALLGQVEAFVDSSRFHHLHFSPTTALWDHLVWG